MRRQVRRGEKGFTLVEILIVLAILGILLAIALPNLTGILPGASAKAGDTEKRTAQSAMDALIADNKVRQVGTRTAANATEISPSFSISVFTKQNAQGTPLASSATSLSFQNYIRTTTQGSYYWDSSGLVSQSQF